MDWDDVEEVLFDGNKEQIDSVRCPDCGGSISFEFNEHYRTFKTACLNCGAWSKGCKAADKPRCAEIYGNKAVLGSKQTNTTPRSV
jgi:hypothetical protein